MVNGKPRQKPRNYILAGGISRYGRSAMYRKKALYKKKIAVKNFQKTKEPHFVVKDVNGAKNGGKRIVLTKKSVSSIICMSFRGSPVKVYQYFMYVCCSRVITQQKTTGDL